MLAYVVFTIDGLSPIDDHQFIRTLFQGKDFGAYISPELGRFFPLMAQEYVLASKLFKPDPGIFYAINAFKALLAGLLLFSALILAGGRNLAIAVLWGIVAGSIGFANAAVRLQVGELNMLILILVFLCTTLILEHTPPSRPGNYRLLVVGGMLAILAVFFYKELGFIFAVVFASAEIIRRYRQGVAISRRLWLLLSIGIAYIAGYLLWRTLYVTGSYATFHTVTMLQVAKMYIKNDPFFVLAVVPYSIFRLVRCLRDAKEQTVCDAMLFSATAYFAAYMALGMFNTYYLLPAYGFAACGVVGSLARIPPRARMSALLLVALLAVNNAPVAIADMQRLKLTANNHYQFVQALALWLRSHPLPGTDRRNIVLVGVDSGSGAEILVSLKTFLVAMGTPESAFDIKVTEPSSNPTVSNFYGFKDKGRYIPVVGDLLLYNPYRQVDARPSLQRPTYQDVCHSASAWALPRWTAWEWLLACWSGVSERLATNRQFVGYTLLLVARTTPSSTKTLSLGK
jgi:hypothetical protein